MSDGSNLDPQTIEQLSEAVGSLSDAELDEVLRTQPGGYRGVLDQAFAGMAQAYVPARAGGQNAVIQWDVTTPEGVETYTLRCGETCEVTKGPAESPRLTLGLSLADYLRLILGRLDGLQAFMMGKLKLNGDVMLAQTMQTWFDRPGS